MFREKDGFFQYFVIMNGETHLLETRNAENPVTSSSFFVDRLNEEYLLHPCWEAVGAFCFSAFRKQSRTTTTYVSSEIHYDLKKPIYQAAKDLAGRELPATFHETVDIQGDDLPHLEGAKTLGRDENGYWMEKDLPVYRAIFADNRSSSHDDLTVDGYSLSVDSSDQIFVEMSPSEDRFVHFCSPEEAERIRQDEEIPLGDRDSFWTPSVLWGGDPDISSDAESAFIFETSHSPSFAEPKTGAMWKESIPLEDFSPIDASTASKARPLSPLPSKEKIRDVLDLDSEFDLFIRYKSDKEARLPLGDPGGPCQVIYNIEDSDLPESVKEEMKGDVREDGELDKGDEKALYDRKTLQLREGFFDSLVLTDHVQHRMDLRSVSADDLKDAFHEFGRWFSYRKENPREMSRDDKEKIQGLKQKETIKFEASKSGLTIVFTLGDRIDELVLVTTYWTGKPDPDAPSPGECEYLLERQSMTDRLASRAMCSECDCSPDKCDCDDCDCDENLQPDHSSYPSEELTKYLGWASHYYPLRG